MATTLYDTTREGHLGAEIDWDTAVIKIALVRGYTYSAAHKFMSDVTGAGGTVVGTPQTLTAKTIAAGVADAADPTFTAVPSGTAIQSLVIYQASAVGGGADVAATAQRVILHTDNFTGLPITPNGGDIAVAFDNGANRIYKL